jgi:hypothetical protein
MSKFSSLRAKARSITTPSKKKESDNKPEQKSEKKVRIDSIISKRRNAVNLSIALKPTPSNSEENSDDSFGKSGTPESSGSFDLPTSSNKNVPLRPKFASARPSMRTQISVQPQLKIFSPRPAKDDLLQPLLKNSEDTDVPEPIDAATTSPNEPTVPFSQELRLVDSEGGSGSFENQRREVSEAPEPLKSIISPRNFTQIRPSKTIEQEITISSRNLEAIDGEKMADMARAAKVKRKGKPLTRGVPQILPTITDAPSIRNHLPTGMILDIYGNVSGKHTFTHHHVERDYRGDELQFSGKPIEEVLNILAANQRAEPLLVGNSPDLIGLKLGKFAARDFTRMNYEIRTNDGQVTPLPRPSPEQVNLHATLLADGGVPTASEVSQAKKELREDQMVRALRDFTNNDDKVAFVLSSVLVQQIPTELQNTVIHATAPFRALTAGTALRNDRTPRPLTIDIYGKKQPVDLTGLGGVVVLSRDGDNFKVNFDYTTYVEAKYEQRHEFPLHQDGVIGIHFKAEIIVNGQAARSEQPEVTMPNGVQVEYFGRLKLD